MIREAKEAVVATITNSTVMNWVIASLSAVTLALMGVCTYYVMDIRKAADANTAAIAVAKRDIADNDKNIAILTERQQWWNSTLDQLRGEMRDLKAAISKLDDKLDGNGMK